MTPRPYTLLASLALVACASQPQGASSPTTPAQGQTTSAAPAPPPGCPPPGSEAQPPSTPFAVKYRADVGKCMRGEPVDPGSMVGGGTCAALKRAAATGDSSDLPKGAADAFKQIRCAGG